MNHSEVRATASAQRRWRQIKDMMTTTTITAGGIGVLLSILLIFFYLLYEIMPLFRTAGIESHSHYSLQSDSPAIFLAMEEQAEVGFRISESGQVLFFQVADGKVVLEPDLPLSAPVRSFALESEDSRVFALGMEDGNFAIAKHDYKVSYPGDKRLITPSVSYPYGEDPLFLSDSPITQLAIRDSEEALVVVGVANNHLVGRRWNKEEDFLSDEITLVDETLNLPTLDINADRLLIGPTQQWLYVVSNEGDYRLISLRTLKIADRGRLFEDAGLSDVRFLLGGISLIASSDDGRVAQWFVV
ncbi:MAG: phosphate ABC transporter permease, partial [Spongiibacter sp.]